MQIVLLATLFGIGFNGLLSTSVPDGESSIAVSYTHLTLPTSDLV